MASLYREIEKKVEDAQKEIEHLNNERNELRKAEKDMPRASYIAEDASLRNHIARQQQIIEETSKVCAIVEHAPNCPKNGIFIFFNPIIEEIH